MEVPLRPLVVADARAHCAGEDDLTVRWLTGGYGNLETTTEYIEELARDAAAGAGKRAFGVWLGDRLCGYVDYDPDLDDGLEPGDVNLTYAVHPWARGRGIAAQAVHLVCQILRNDQVGTRAVIRVEPENLRSVRVAEKAGFVHIRELTSDRDTRPDGTPTRFSLYGLDLYAGPHPAHLTPRP